MDDLREEYERELRRMKNEDMGGEDPKGKNKFFPFDLFLLISFGIFVFLIIYTKYVPLKIELIIVGIGVLIGLVGYFIKNRGIKGFSGFLLLILSGALIYGQVAIDNLVGSSDSYHHKMSFVVMADSPMENIVDAQGKNFGKASDLDDTLWEKFLGEYGGKLVGESDVSTYKDYSSLLEALYGGELDVVLFDEANRDLVKEDYPDFDKETRVLGNIETKTEKTPAKNVNVTKEPFIVYISGIDTSGNISNRSRSDVNILAVVNPNVNKVLLVSVPRDSYMEIPAFNNNKDKITHSGLEGTGATMDALKQFFGYDINYYSRFNFTSVINIINIIGKVDVYSHYTFTSRDGYQFKEGMNTVDGKKALSFVRERYNVPNGDKTRGIHQMELIKGTINALLRPENIFRLNGVISEVSKNLDTNMSSDEVSRIISNQLDLGSNLEIKQMQLEGVGRTGNYSYLIPGKNIFVMFPSDESKMEIINAIENLINER